MKNLKQELIKINQKLCEEIHVNLQNAYWWNSNLSIEKEEWSSINNLNSYLIKPLPNLILENLMDTIILGWTIKREDIFFKPIYIAPIARNTVIIFQSGVLKGEIETLDFKDIEYFIEEIIGKVD